MDKTAERNHGLFRIASLTSWVAAGAVAVTGVFTFLAAHPKLHLLPKPVSTDTGGTSGGDVSSTGVDNSGASSTGVDSSGASSSANGGGLQAPAQLPAAGRGSAHVSSGGS